MIFLDRQCCYNDQANNHATPVEGILAARSKPGGSGVTSGNTFVKKNLKSKYNDHENTVYKFDQSDLPENVEILSGPCDNYERMKENEGYSKSMYLDTKGLPTIGIGFNLARSDARAKITAVGANYDLIMAHKQNLTDAQIRTLFNGDMAQAVSCAQQFAGDIATTPLSAIADMAFAGE